MDVAAIYKSDAGRRAVEQQYVKALQRWPVPHRQLRLPTRQGQTFVIVSGEEHATPVVLFHGSGTNTSAWMDDAAVWAHQFRVYAVDTIGEPGFSAPSRPPFASNAYVEWLDDVWNQLGLQRACIVGLSLGGWLALEYAVKRPARVASLSLIAPSGVGAQNMATLLKAGLLMKLGPWGLRKALAIVTGRAAVPKEIADSLILRFQHFRPRMDALPIRSDDELARLTMPVQLIVGGRDTLLRSSETRDRMLRCVPHLRLTYLENEGHILPKQTDAVASFLRDVSKVRVAV
jgi:pimeloyl-ACP methyl ester carboxylesterase